LFGVSNSIATMNGSLGMYAFFDFVLNEFRNALNNVWTWDIYVIVGLKEINIATRAYPWHSISQGPKVCGS
jgi:hypothetical protein